MMCMYAFYDYHRFEKISQNKNINRTEFRALLKRDEVSQCCTDKAKVEVAISGLI